MIEENVKNQRIAEANKEKLRAEDIELQKAYAAKLDKEE